MFEYAKIYRLLMPVGLQTPGYGMVGLDVHPSHKVRLMYRLDESPKVNWEHALL